jgi:hypothetical protein
MSATSPVRAMLAPRFHPSLIYTSTQVHLTSATLSSALLAHIHE